MFQEKRSFFKFSHFFLKLHASALRTLKRDYKGILQIYVSLIATGYGLDGRGIGIRVPVVKIFLFSTTSRSTLGPTHTIIE